jgi:hypothetical protein
MVIVGLMSLTSGTALSKAATNDERAFLDMGRAARSPTPGGV